MIRKPRLLAALILGTAALGAAAPAHADDPLSGYTLYGLTGSGDQLLKYEFSSRTLTRTGSIYLPSGTRVSGITAMAYVPRCNQIYGFWNDPSDGLSKLLYLDMNGHNAKVVGSALGTGVITAATTLRPAGAASPSRRSITPVATAMGSQIYAVQIGLTISGTININPNNSSDSQFILTKPDGTTITRDDLASSKLTVDQKGNFYYGGATTIRIQPKGNGNQNGVFVGGQPYWMANGDVYLISSKLWTVRLYNDKAKNGKAMGQWYLEIASGTGTIQDLGPDGSGNNTAFSSNRFGQIIKVDPATGITTQVMVVNAPFDDIAGTAEGSPIYGSYGNTLYKLDPVNKTQTAVGSLAGVTDGHTLEYAGDNLVGFSCGTQTLYFANPSNGATQPAGYNIGVAELHDSVFQRTPDAPNTYAANND